MAQVFPFCAIRPAQHGDVSTRIAPPYDVIDAHAKQALLERDPYNIVAIDLPQVPAKDEGPHEIYEQAARTLEQWLGEGLLERASQPAMYAYRQSFRFQGHDYKRCGMACCVETVPFGPREGGGILPHEQTFGGPKADRLALMKATRTQLSCIFGLHQDEDGSATAILHEVMATRSPDMTATTDDGVYHEVWFVEDEATIGAYQRALEGEDIFVADGHHRYTTALNYLRELGDVPEDHPARRTMFVLVGMSDPGLAIGATHRVLGNMSGYAWDAFERASEGLLNITPTGEGPESLEDDMRVFASEQGEGVSVLGLIDMQSGSCFMATPVSADPLAERFPDKPEAWRTLDVAIVQHLIVDQICVPKLNAGEPVRWAFPHTVEEVMRIARGEETGAGGGEGFQPQLAVVVRPTPLEAVREISRAGELMPQKSTFFYPKLATGLFMYPLA